MSSLNCYAAGMCDKLYNSRIEIVGDINRLGNQFAISDELVSTPYVHMLVCRNYTSKCRARIIGLYDQQRGKFAVRRCDLKHSCGVDQSEATAQEVEKRRGERIGESVEEMLSRGIDVGYEEVYRIMMNEDENTANDGSWHIKAIKSFINEFKELNQGVYADADSTYCYVYIPAIRNALREPAELKLYQRRTGFVILLLQYDPANEPVIQSLFVADLCKAEAVKQFVKSYRAANLFDASSKAGLSDNFFIIEPDLDLIEILQACGVEFFLKTRSVCAYLEEDKDDDPLSFQYFHECNYGTKELLKLDKKYYLRQYCKYSLFNINNMPLSDIDFINESLLSLPLLECFNSAIWNLERVLRRKRKNARREGDKLPDLINEMIEELRNTERGTTLADISAGKCWCGKFQEFLIPCEHASAWLKQHGVDPYHYVSSIYLISRMREIPELVPVMGVEPEHWIQVERRRRKMKKLGIEK